MVSGKSMVETSPGSYFERVGPTGYRPTVHAGGAWADDELHMAPVAGAITDAVDRHLTSHSSPLVPSRISFDILGKIPAAAFDVEVRVVRPGRTIELLEATMVSGGRAVVQARVWLLSRQDTTAVAGGRPDPLPDPESLPAGALGGGWPGGFVASLDVRSVDVVPGRARAWVSTTTNLVAGEQVSDLARFVGLVDTANGVAVRESPREWMFPNVDLTIHLYRQPRGRWVGLDTTVTFGVDGQGLTSSILHDVEGPVGRSEQILTVRRLPG